MIRMGQGYDLHRLVEGRKLLLGGVKVANDKGLLGHSDADALVHAIIDALLGAAALGDIGNHFPDTAPEFKDADSIALLAQVVEELGDAGYIIGNVDSTIIAETPKLATYIMPMRERIAGALGIAVDKVSVKAKTNEGLGPEGRGEAISCHAVAVLEKRED